MKKNTNPLNEWQRADSRRKDRLKAVASPLYFNGEDKYYRGIYVYMPGKTDDLTGLRKMVDVEKERLVSTFGFCEGFRIVRVDYMPPILKRKRIMANQAMIVYDVPTNVYELLK